MGLAATLLTPLAPLAAGVSQEKNIEVFCYHFLYKPLKLNSKSLVKTATFKHKKLSLICPVVFSVELSRATACMREKQ